MKKIFFMALVAIFSASGIATAQNSAEPIINVSGGLNSALHGSLVVDGGIKVNDFWSVAATATGSTQGVVMPGVFGGVDLSRREDRHIIFTPYIGGNMLLYKELRPDGKGNLHNVSIAKPYPLIGLRMTHYRAIAFDIRYTGWNASLTIGWAFAGRRDHK